MHYCKINSRLLARLPSSLKRPQRHSSIAAVKTTEPKLSEPSAEPQENPRVAAVKKKYKLDQIEFPPILDLSYRGKKRSKREEWHDRVKQLGTVEEKIFELNMPKYYGWKLFKIEEGSLPYDPLPWAQYVTRTHIHETPGLPSYYDSVISSEKLDAYVQQIKSQVEDALVFEYCSRKQDYQYTSDELEDKSFLENLKSEALSQDINRILTFNLSPKYPHLLEAQLDLKPRIEAFWFFGGCEAPKEIVQTRKGQKWMQDYIYDPINQNIQYYGSPMLNIRHNLPLKEILPLKDCENISLKVPVHSYDPRKLGYFMERQRATIVPGFWPGDHNEFGIISYHSRAHLLKRPGEYNDDLDALKAQAVFGSFSWLYGQACYQGFSTFQDPTYPLVNQMIITNGQWWSFGVYQLNTTTMHIDRIDENQKRNIFWITEPMKLFDSIKDGKVLDLNEDVLKHLIKFYTNVPQIREGIDMKPYLDKDEMVIAGIEEPERRVWLEQRYKHLISKRSRHRLYPEIYHWHYIYKIKFKTRPWEKRIEPCEFGIPVYNRRLDDHTPQFIPRAKRENKKKLYPLIRNKFEKTYYPSIRRNKKVD